MSAVTTDRGDGAATSAQVDALVDQCAALKQALARGRMLRRLLLLGLLAFFCAFGWNYWQLLEKLRSKEYSDQLTVSAQARLQERSDQYMKEVQALVEKTTPVVAEAFTKQFHKDLPAYLKAAEAEGNKFAQEIRSQAETKYRNQLEAMLKKHETILAEEIPTLKDIQRRERMVNNMRKAFDQIGQRYAIDPIAQELTALYDKWDKFPAVPPPSPGDLPLEDRVVGLSGELVLNKLVESRRGSQ